MRKRRNSMWQITLPLSIFSIAGISLLAAVYLSSGKYEFKFNATKEGVNIETRVDK